MTKRRIILIIVSVVVTAFLINLVVAFYYGDFFWLVYKIRGTTSERLLARAELAVQARKFDKALSLLDRYIAKYPDDWRGYHVQGQAHIRLARYADARGALEKATKLAPDRMEVWLGMADTHSLPARRALASDTTVWQVADLQKVIEQLEKANEILTSAKTQVRGRDAQLEVKQCIGLNDVQIGAAHTLMSKKLAKDAETAKASGVTDIAQTRQKESEAAAEEAEKATKRGMTSLLEVVAQDGSRERPALVLIQLCAERNDTDSLAKVRHAVMSCKDPPPLATMMLAVDEMRSKAAKLDANALRQMFIEKAELLDRLLKEHPEQQQVKLTRAELALLLADLPTAEKLSNEVLKTDPRQAQARMIHASVLWARANVVDAEQELYSLKTDFPRWPRAQFAYGQAALAVGKKELARDALRLAVKLDPSNADANKLLAQIGLQEKSYDQAVTDARAGYEARSNDPMALRLYIEALRRTEQLAAAREVLARAEKEHATKPEMLMGVAEGYAMLGDNEEVTRLAKLIVESKPTTTEGQVAVARALVLIRRPAEAEAILNQELTRDPKQPSVCFELGRLYTVTNRNFQSLELYRRAVEGNNNINYRLTLAKALFDVGNLEECSGVLEQVDASNPTANMLRMQIALIQGKGVDTKQVLQQVGEGKQSGLPLALLYLAGGQTQQCVDVCQAELKKNPNDLDVQTLLGQAYLVLGQRDKCMEQWKAVLAAAPSRLAVYLQMASVLGTQERPAYVAADLAKLPGARRDMVDLATAWLFTKLGKNDQARVLYEMLANDTKAEDDIRHRAKLLLADSLAREGRVDEALTQLQDLVTDKVWRNPAMEAKARLLVLAKRYKDAGSVLQELRKLGVAEKNGTLMEHAVGLYLEMAQPKEALAVCDQMQTMLPDDARSWLLRAAVQRSDGKIDDMIKSYQKAIELQPGAFEVYQALCRALDAENRPLAAMDVLKKLEGVSQAGRALSLSERGSMFARWGLQAKAVESFRKLAEEGYSNNPQIQLTLGNALAGLGQKDAARELLKKIPAYSGQYMPAQQLLAELESNTEAALAIVRQLAKARKGQGDVLVQELSLLTRANRPADVVKAFQAYAGENDVVPEQAAPLALQAMLQTGDRAGAANLCASRSSDGKAPQWRYLAVLLAMDDKPEEAAKALAPPASATVLDALLGICLAARTGDFEAVKAWYARLGQIEEAIAKLSPPQFVSGRFKVLAALASGATGQADTEVAKPGRVDVADVSVAKELVASAVGNPKAAGEAVILLKASLASELGVPILGRKWAMEVFQARPTCQWGADLAARSQADLDTQKKILSILQPKDCVLAMSLQGSILMEGKQYDKAAEIFAAAVKASNGNLAIVLNEAMATEKAGRLKEAMEQYRQILAMTKHPVAANNAAYLVSLLWANDVVKLAEAHKWMEEAIKTNPNVAAFHDTIGWLSYLRGDKEAALASLWQGVKGSPGSVENHYHLGMAEAAAGHEELARWHLTAAVDIGKRLKAEAQEIGPSTAEALRLANEALAKLK